MPLVNLIEEQRIQVKQAESRARFLLVAGGVIGCLGFIAGAFFGLQSIVMNSMSNELIQKEQALKPLTDELDENTKLIAELTPRLDTLTQAQTRTLQWQVILDYLTKNTPQGLYLTGIRCQKQTVDQPVLVTIVGNAQSQEAVSALLLRLELQPDLENPNLRFTQEKRTEWGDAVEFEVVASLKDEPETREQRQGSAREQT